MGMMEEASVGLDHDGLLEPPVHPPDVAIWAIGRGSIAVGAEVERGTLDLILSRPVSRASYLVSHICIGAPRAARPDAALAAGASTGVRYNFLRQPPAFSTLIRPALNLAALGLPIYGYTLLVSALDHVRWRPTMIGSVLTLAGFIAWVISVIPVMQKYTWKVWLERISIFKLYNPVQAVAGDESLTLQHRACSRASAPRASCWLSSASSAATCRPTGESARSRRAEHPLDSGGTVPQTGCVRIESCLRDEVIVLGRPAVTNRA